MVSPEPPVWCPRNLERTFFLARLPIHQALARTGVEAGVEAGVDLNETEARVLSLLRDGPKGTKDLAAALGQRHAVGKVSGGASKGSRASERPSASSP